MDGAEKQLADVPPVRSQIPEFPISQEGRRGLWNNGEEGLWLRLLDLFWRNSYVHERLASEPLPHGARTVDSLWNSLPLDSGAVPVPSAAEEFLPHTRTSGIQSTHTTTRYFDVLRRAIACASALEYAEGETGPPATPGARCKQFTARGQHGEPLKRNVEFNASDSGFLNLQGYTSVHIPLILHFVWCGIEPLPAFFVQFKRSWKKHSRLVHALWRDAEIKDLIGLAKETDYDTHRTSRRNATTPLQSGERESWRQGSAGADKELSVTRTLAELAHMVEEEVRLGAKADLVRLLLLYFYGGVYADVDVELIRELPNCFLTDATFVAGAQREDAVELGNAVLACTPRHELLTYIITQVVEGRKSTKDDEPVLLLRIVERYTGESLLPRKNKLLSPLVGTEREAMEVIGSTGPGQFTRAVMRWLLIQASSSYCEELANYRREEDASSFGSLTDMASVCICPPLFFYPVPNHARNSLNKRGEKAKYTKSRFSLTVHHWKETWKAAISRTHALSSEKL